MRPEQPEKPEEESGFSGDRDDRGSPGHAARSRPGDELLGRALALVRHLREHCPWDARQTPESLRPYLLEEAHETADAILGGDPDELAGELGDLLLNLAFQIVVAEERAEFEAREVVERLEAKMRARHPHVYGDAEEPPDWEALKADERRAAGRGDGPAGAEADGAGRTPDGEEPGASPVEAPFAGLPDGLDALSRALRVQQRAAAVGFDWPDVRGAVGKLREEIGELEEVLAAEGDEAGAGRSGGTVPGGRVAEEVGDLLFAAVNVARLAGPHPETALAAANRKFERRFAGLLRRARERGLDPADASLEELEALWREEKG